METIKQNFIDSVYNSRQPEIDKYSNLTSDEFAVAFLEEYSDISDDEYFNLFGSRKRKGKATPGGKRWNKAEANRFAKKAPKFIAKAKIYLNAIIGQDPAKVKEKRTEDFARMVVSSKASQTELEAAWTTFQKAQTAGFGDSGNRETARKAFITIVKVETNVKRDWKKRHDWVTESVLDKVAQGLKTVNLAPLRGMLLLLVRVNFSNIATFLKLASIRTPEKYKKNRLKFKQLGGNRTKWDKSVDKGYKKKPLFAKKMNIDWNTVSFAGYNADGDDSTGKKLLIPDKIIKAQPALGGAVSQIFSPPTGITNAAWGGIGTAAGTFLELTLSAINKMAVPLGAKESQPEGDDTPPTTEEIAELELEKEKALKDAKDTEYWIPNTPNWLTITVPIVLILAGLGIVYRKKIFNSYNYN